MQVWLEAVGHTVQHFADGKSFMAGIAGQDFELLVMDWILPDIGGDEVLSWVREHIDWTIPVIFVTQRDSEEDVVYVLEKGADDYMTKPVKPLEMLARITALGRRAIPDSHASDVLEFPPFQFQQNSRSLICDGKAIELTQKEYDLALYVFRNAGRLLSRGHLLESVWGRNADLNTRTVDTHISRIRNKLGLSAERGWRLSAVYQHGYRLERMQGGGLAVETSA